MLIITKPRLGVGGSRWEAFRGPRESQSRWRVGFILTNTPAACCDAETERRGVEAAYRLCSSPCGRGGGLQQVGALKGVGRDSILAGL